MLKEAKELLCDAETTPKQLAAVLLGSKFDEATPFCPLKLATPFSRSHSCCLHSTPSWCTHV